MTFFRFVSRSIVNGVARAAFGSVLGSRLRTPVIEGQSVFDLLSEERIDTEDVRKALVSCALLLEQAMARPRPRSAAEIAKQYGLRSQSKHSQEESVAQETGL